MYVAHDVLCGVAEVHQWRRQPLLCCVKPAWALASVRPARRCKRAGAAPHPPAPPLPMPSLLLQLPVKRRLGVDPYARE